MIAEIIKVVADFINTTIEIHTMVDSEDKLYIGRIVRFPSVFLSLFFGAKSALMGCWDMCTAMMWIRLRSKFTRNNVNAV
jgi:hypothetical protein